MACCASLSWRQKPQACCGRGHCDFHYFSFNNFSYSNKTKLNYCKIIWRTQRTFKFVFFYIFKLIEPAHNALNALNAYLILMVPKYVCWWLWTELDDARKINSAASVHIEIGSAQDRRCWHCNRVGMAYESYEAFKNDFSLTPPRFSLTECTNKSSLKFNSSRDCFQSANCQHNVHTF